MLGKKLMDIILNSGFNLIGIIKLFKNFCKNRIIYSFMYMEIIGA